MVPHSYVNLYQPLSVKTQLQRTCASSHEDAFYQSSSTCAHRDMLAVSEAFLYQFL